MSKPGFIDYTTALAAADLCLLNLDKVRECSRLADRETALYCAAVQYQMVRKYALSTKGDLDPLIATLELRRVLREARRQLNVDTREASRVYA